MSEAADKSGGRDKGFGSSEDTAPNGAGFRFGSPLRLIRSWRGASPISWTLFISALGFFALFVTYDAYETVQAAKSRLQLSATLLAHEISTAPREDALSVLNRLHAALNDGSHVALIANPKTNAPSTNAPMTAVTTDGSPLATPAEPTPPRLAGTVPPRSLDAIEARSGAGAQGTVAVSLPHMSVLEPVVERALVGAAMILLLLMVLIQGHLRRNRTGVLPPTLEQFLNGLPHGAACWSENGTLIAANRPFFAQMGTAQPFVGPGTPYAAAIGHLSATGTMSLIIESEGRRLSELSCFDGTTYEVEELPLANGGFMTLMVDKTGERVMRGQIEDLSVQLRRTTQKLHEQELRGDAAGRSKVQFLAHLNHELRTPLNHIIGFADLIGHESYGPVGDKRYLTYTQHIKQSGEVLLAALSNILELAEFNAGERPVRQEPVRLSELMTWSEERFAQRAERAGVGLTVGPCDALVLSGERHLFQRMLGNILDNALRFTPQGGTVSLAAWTASDGVVLEVTDTGVGIAPERLSQLNQSFILGEDAFKLTKTGGGLGIAIARAIAELNGGQMAINSTPGIGTTVAISLPGNIAGAQGRISVA